MTVVARPCALRLALLLALASFGAGCDDHADGATDVAPSESVRGTRYCEVLLAFVTEGAIEAQVWGTQGLNDCPEAAWVSIEPSAIREAFDATFVVLNGPRHWVLDRASGERPAGSPRMFASLEMQQLASLTLAPGTVSSTLSNATRCSSSTPDPRFTSSSRPMARST